MTNDDFAAECARLAGLLQQAHERTMGSDVIAATDCDARTIRRALRCCARLSREEIAATIRRADDAWGSEEAYEEMADAVLAYLLWEGD